VPEVSFVLPVSDVTYGQNFGKKVSLEKGIL
jgi:hypothetical protein